MKIIKRNYLETLEKIMGTPDIKIITGVRRSGKSTLLKSFEEYVSKKFQGANIVHVDFNNVSFEFLQEYHKLNEYVESHYVPNTRNFVFIDEVQMCDGFEKTINSLHSTGKYDIYITGSNAFLMASDLATLFTGRVFPIEVFPFSFKEYAEYFSDKKKDQYELLDGYLMDGGFSGSYVYDDQSERYNYLSTVYDTILLRDIEQKHKIQNVAGFRRLGDFLMDNIGNQTSGRNITNSINDSAISNRTVEQYLTYLCEAFIFYRAKRYDIEGKKYLQTQDKYYLCDHALRFAKLGTKEINYGRVYENIVAIELLRRGYEIYVGAFRNKEIDFVAKKRDEKFYVQVSYDITNESTLEREVSPLVSIQDAYPKFIIARTRQPEQIKEGVHIFDLADWLLKDNFLGN